MRNINTVSKIETVWDLFSHRGGNIANSMTSERSSALYMLPTYPTAILKSDLVMSVLHLLFNNWQLEYPINFFHSNLSKQNLLFPLSRVVSAQTFRLSIYHRGFKSKQKDAFFSLQLTGSSCRNSKRLNAPPPSRLIKQAREKDNVQLSTVISLCRGIYQQTPKTKPN